MCTGGVLEEGFSGGGVAQHLQQQAVGDVGPLAALQREHVLLPCGAGRLRSQADELPWALVRTRSSGAGLRKALEACNDGRPPRPPQKLSTTSVKCVNIRHI